MMTKCAAVVLTAGLAIGVACGTAYAGPEKGHRRDAAGQFNLPLPTRATPVVKQVQQATLNGVPQQPRHSTDAPELVYQNITMPHFTIGTPPGGAAPPRANAADGMSFTPGPGAGGPVLITGIKPTIAVVTDSPGPQSYEVLITFWNTIDAGVAPPGSVLVGKINADPIRVGFVDPTPPGSFSIPFDFVDLTSLPGGGIQIPDDNFAIQCQYVELGTTTKAQFGTVAFAGGGVTPGSSDDLIYLDFNPEDGTFTSQESGWFGGPPNMANFYFEIQGMKSTSPPPPPSCLANCNGDTDPVSGKPKLDVLDFTCFQNAFALADKAKADVGGSAGCLPDGDLNIFDFTCFQNLFALGCP